MYFNTITKREWRMLSRVDTNRQESLFERDFYDSFNGNINMKFCLFEIIFIEEKKIVKYFNTIDFL